MKTLDLHGLKKDPALTKVNRFLMDHHHLPKVKIITGKGTGTLHKAVVNYLKIGHYPWSYEKLANGSDNHGVLIIHLS